MIFILVYHWIVTYLAFKRRYSQISHCLTQFEAWFRTLSHRLIQSEAWYRSLPQQSHHLIVNL